MLTSGSIVNAEGLGKLRVEEEIGQGGQARVFRATARRTGETWVLKVFQDEARKADYQVRTRRLVDLALGSASPMLCGPTASLAEAGLAGHVSPFVEGIPLADLVYPPGDLPVTSLADNLSVAAALSHAFMKLNDDLGAVHGDIHTQNAMVLRKEDTFEVIIIDFDNWMLRCEDPTLPAPPMAGHIQYMAPELRGALEAGRAPRPTLESDLFALGIVLHEVILQRHVGVDLMPEDFHDAMMEPWRNDPARPHPSAVETCGYPTAVLNAELTRLFRRSIHPHPGQRASARQWRQALCEALGDVYACPSCARPFVTDVSRQSCPHCMAGFPVWELVAPGGRFPLDGPTRIVGRSEWGGSPNVSKRHCVFRRLGPAIKCESIGLNPTQLIRGGTQRCLNPGEILSLEPGDRLRIADVEITVRPLAA